jgi:dihydrofolate reductase
MRISIIVALSKNGVIGADGGIPWRLPDDQRHFKKLTTGHCILMGRATHESIGRLLPDRHTIVISRNPDLQVAGADVAASFEAAVELARARGESEAFVVGGADIYALALPLADDLHLTRVATAVSGDIRFPLAGDDLAVELDAHWKLSNEEQHAADERHAHAFTIQHWTRASAQTS